MIEVSIVLINIIRIPSKIVRCNYLLVIGYLGTWGSVVIKALRY